MTFRKASTLLLPLLLLVLAWIVWNSGPSEHLEIPEVPQRSDAVSGPVHQAEARHDGLLHAPRFRVLVLDDRGLPFVDAEVQVCGAMKPREVLALGSSGPRGGCELQPDRAACSHRYVVRARAQEDFPWVVTPILDPGAEPIAEVPPLRISRPARIDGLVLDPEQRPLAGIDVVFVDGTKRTILGEENPGRRVRTSATGMFSLRVPPGREQLIRVLGSEHYRVPEQPPRSFPPGPNRLTLRLQRLPDSELMLRFWTWMRRPHPGVRHAQRPTMEPGRVHLEAFADLPLPTVILQQDIQVPRTGRVDVFMPRGCRLALEPRPLLPGTQKVAVRFAWLSGQARGRTPQHPLSAPAEGRFDADLVQDQVLLHELRPGRWRFWIQAPGWPEAGPVEVDLREDVVRPVKIVPLIGPCQLTGSLLTADSKPVPGRLLRLYAIDGSGTIPRLARAPNTGWLVQVRTDSHGEFRFVGLPEVQYQVWSRDAGGRETPLTEGRLHSGPNPPLRLLLRK